MKTPAPLQYQVDASGTHDHTYRVTLTIAQPDAAQVVSLPVWIAGSYMVREFGRHLSGLQARQGRAARAVQHLDKTKWQIDWRGALALVCLLYTYYAADETRPV
jgi:predicted metalloprotease with PDZ domain